MSGLEGLRAEIARLGLSRQRDMLVRRRAVEALLDVVEAAHRQHRIAGSGPREGKWIHSACDICAALSRLNEALEEGQNG